MTKRKQSQSTKHSRAQVASTKRKGRVAPREKISRPTPPRGGAPHPPKSAPPIPGGGFASIAAPVSPKQAAKNQKGAAKGSGAGRQGPGVGAEQRAGSGARFADLVAARAVTHGEFHAVAAISQTIKRALASGPSWGLLTDVQTETLEHIATKLARAVCGDPAFADHVRDVGGYAFLHLIETETLEPLF